MSVTFTFIPANNIGKLRTKISDIRVGTLLDKVVATQDGRLISFASASNLGDSELIGQFIYPDTTSAISYKITANTVSGVTIFGDISNSVASAGTSAVVNEAIFADEELNVFLNDASNDIFKAAAIGLRAIAANQALLAKKFKKTGIGGIEIEKREIKQILDLADSYDKKANSVPASEMKSYEYGDGKREDDFETDDMNEFGDDINVYRKA